MAPDPSPPVADKHPQETTVHGVTRKDDYGWLRADNWQAVMQDPTVLDKSIREHLEAENRYQETWMSDTAILQKTLFGEMKGRIKEDDSSVPLKDGPWAYGVSFIEGGEHPQYIRKRVEGDDATILLDGDVEARDKAYFRIGGCSHSPDHKTIAWSHDDKGSEYFTISFRDTNTASDGEKTIAKTSGGGIWTKQSDAFFYTRLDQNHRPSKLYLHGLDTNEDDRLVFEEPDPGFFMGVGKSQSGETVIIDIHDHQTSEAWIVPADAPDTKPSLIAPRETGVEYSVDEGHGTLYILTNRDGAEDFKITTAPSDNPQPENWVDLVPHEQGRLILSHSIYARHLVWLERRDGLPRIVVHRLRDGKQHSISFEEEAYSLSLGGAYEFDTDTIRFTYSSMTTPAQTFDYHMETGERCLLKTQEVPSGHNPENYITRRLHAEASDGETIPISLIYHEDTPLDGSAPCLLYGYGAYGVTIPASFNTSLLSLVDRGLVYAIAHVRGGKDKGFRWYDLGRRKNKPNTFTDFLDAAEYLISERFTSKGKVIAHGGSAGGMLMGAVANMRPDLFASILAEVPFSTLR